MAKESKNNNSYAAFLRGIGPGDPKKSNESLRKVFTSLGFKNVQSFISSGNILFESPEKNTQALERVIEQGFKQKLDLDISVFVRSQKELEAFVASGPFGKRTHTKTTYLIVTFYKEDSLSLSPTSVQAKMKEVIAVDASLRAVCSVVDTVGTKTPDFMAKLEKVLGKKNTTRTINTLERMLKRFA